jgi:hypothetical protein
MLQAAMLTTAASPARLPSAPSRNKMPKTSRETATTFVLAYLTEHADREMQLKDLHEGCEGQFSVANMQQSLIRLLGEGKVVRNNDGKAAWWAIASDELKSESKQVGPMESPRKSKLAVATQKGMVNKDKALSSPVEKAKPELTPVPATPASMTDAAKAFVLDVLKDKGVPMTLLELLGQRPHGHKHVNLRNLKLATYYLQHDKKLRAEERDGNVFWTMV